MTEHDDQVDAVRRRPGMYLGGTDEPALHKLAAEILSNALAEAMTGHANVIEVTLKNDGSVTIIDNGRGIPVDLHPKFPGKSALEIIFTTLHSSGRYGNRAHGPANDSIGINLSVVNALSDWLWVEVVRNSQLYRQSFVRGKPSSKLENLGPTKNPRGTTVCFHPDAEIFGPNVVFTPARLYELARYRASLFGGVEILWRCEPAVVDGKTPTEERFLFPKGSLEKSD